MLLYEACIVIAISMLARFIVNMTIVYFTVMSKNFYSFMEKVKSFAYAGITANTIILIVFPITSYYAWVFSLTIMVYLCVIDYHNTYEHIKEVE
jgi:hypothetical protein